jgi:hypothetical protein
MGTDRVTEQAQATAPRMDPVLVLVQAIVLIPLTWDPMLSCWYVVVMVTGPVPATAVMDMDLVTEPAQAMYPVMDPVLVLVQVIALAVNLKQEGNFSVERSPG